MAFSSQSGEPGACLQRVFAPRGSRRDIKGTAVAESCPESLRSRPREVWSMQVWAGPKPGWLGVKGAHFRPRAADGRRAEGAFAVARQEHSAKASLAVVSFAGNLKRVLLCREVWKCLSPFPRDLAALPDLPSIQPTLKSSPFK